jgi:hypothetical protein
MTRSARLLTAALLAAALAALPHGGIASESHDRSSGWQQKAAARTGGALATFRVGGDRFRLWTTSPAAISGLKALRAGTSTASIPNGRVRRGPGIGRHNAPWHWHLDARDIQMAEVTTEACDGTPSYVESHVGEFVGTVKRYCPWAAKLVALKVYPATQLAAPGNLAIRSLTSDGTSAQITTATLTWKDRSSAEGRFEITASLTRRFGSPGKQTWTAPANATTATVQFVAGGINPLDSICFTVRAASDSSVSPPSQAACASL